MNSFKQYFKEAKQKWQPAIHQQGKTIVQKEDEGFLIMFPDGNIEWKATKPQVISAAKKWFKKHLNKDSIGVGELEWRK